MPKQLHISENSHRSYTLCVKRLSEKSARVQRQIMFYDFFFRTTPKECTRMHARVFYFLDQ